MGELLYKFEGGPFHNEAKLLDDAGDHYAEYKFGDDEEYGSDTSQESASWEVTYRRVKPDPIPEGGPLEPVEEGEEPVYKMIQPASYYEFVREVDIRELDVKIYGPGKRRDV